MNNIFNKYSFSIVFASFLFASFDGLGQAASSPDLNVPVNITTSAAVTTFPDLTNYANTANRNYIRKYAPQNPETNSANITLSKLNIGQSPMPVTTTYFDGLGRPLQEVARQAVNSNGDLVRVHAYDAVGRETYQYLPYTATRYIAERGKLETTPLTKLPAFYQSRFPGEHPYAKTETDNTPSNKVIKTLAPGSNWIGSNRGVNITYATNSNSPVDILRRFTIGYNGLSDLPVSAGPYASNMLYLTRTRDEDGKARTEYRDKNNRVVAVQTELYLPPLGPSQDWHTFYDITQYVYDDLGRLRFTITPEAYRQSYLNNGGGTITTALADGLCYRYWYDERGRLIEKKLPGKETEYFVYDTKDRQVLRQDGNMRISDQWQFTIYDGLNRPVGTGMVTLAGATQASLTADIATGGFSPPDLLYYLSSPVKELSLVSITGGDLHTVTQYDDYTPYNLGTFDASYNSQLAGFAANLYVPAQANHTRGAATHNVVRTTDGQYYATDYYYDDFGRMIQQKSTNIKGGQEVITNVYDFSGALMGSHQFHENPDAISPDANHPGMHQQTELLTKYTKAPMSGIITAVTQNVNQTGDKAILTNSLDDLNRVYAKTRMGFTDNYSYNIRGWLTGINDQYADAGVSGGTGPFFGEKIAYDNGFTSKYYNGNIAGIEWRGAGGALKRSYGYEYDHANRLSFAEFRQWENNVWTNSNTDLTVKSITYDYNGNLKSMLQRGPGNGGPVDMDDMSYTYLPHSNQLAGVVDNGLYSAATPDFKDDPSSSNADYDYDANGNLKMDLNKGISNAITYTPDNKPDHIEIDQQGIIEYVYDALGNKLQKTVTPFSTGTPDIYDYFGNFEYKNDVLQSIAHPEGRYRPDAVADANGTATYQTDLYVKDHLGNVRTVVNAQYAGIRNVLDYTADLEVALANTEGLIWGGLDEVRDDKPVSGGPSDAMAAALNGADPDRQIGTTLMLRVMPGDKFRITADNYYEDYDEGMDNTTNDGMMEALFTTLMGGSTYSGVPVSELPDNMAIIQSTVGSGSFPIGYQNLVNNYTDPSLPKSYLNYLVIAGDGGDIDNDRSGALQANSMSEWGQVATAGEVEVNEPGYLLLFSSAASHADVFWDKINVTFYRGNVIEENHYYPFGLTLSQASANPNEKNNYKLTTKELQPELGLNWYGFGARMQDMQTGRWLGIDEKAEKYVGISHYVYCANNPVIFLDPDGKDITLSYKKTQDARGNTNITANATINLTIVDPKGQLTGVDRSYITQYGNVFGGQGITTLGAKGNVTNLDISTEINLNVVQNVDQAKATDYIIQVAENIPGSAIGLANNMNGDVGAVENKYIGKEFANTAMHELGHILGFQHREGSLMKEGLDNKGDKNTYKVNSADKTNVWKSLIGTMNKNQGTIRTYGSPEDSRKEMRRFLNDENISIP